MNIDDLVIALRWIGIILILTGLLFIFGMWIGDLIFN